MRTTVTALYQDADTAKSAMRALLDEGFSRNDIAMQVNLVARERDPFKQSKTHYWRRGQVDAPMGVLLGLLAGLVIGAAVGALLSVFPLTYPLATMAGWGAILGGLSGAVTGLIANSNIPRIRGQNLTTVAKSGATLVQVQVAEEDVDRVQGILGRYRPVDLGDRQSAWGERGWEAYDPASEAVR